MHVLLGEGTGAYIEKLIKANGWGRMWIAVSRNIYVLPGERWGFDNGAFRFWIRGELFDDDAYMRRLDKAIAVGTPYMAVLPDIVAAGAESLDFSMSWLERLPRDWPWYLPVQDGMSVESVSQCLPYISGLFLGGTKAFKVTAGQWSDLAHENGRLFHYGRCGTLRAVAHALRVYADSIDSAFPLWERRRMGEFVLATQGQPRQADLFREPIPEIDA